jgi:hypothetical protein
MWRKTLGTTVAAPYDGADGDGDTNVDSGDHSVWRSNFGESLPGAGGGGGILESLTRELVVDRHATTDDSKLSFTSWYESGVASQPARVDRAFGTWAESGQSIAMPQNLALVAWLTSLRAGLSEQMERADACSRDAAVANWCHDEFVSDIDAVFDLMSTGGL